LGTKEERMALLSAEHELKTPSLCQALIWQGNQLRSRSEYARAHEIYDLAVVLAQEIRDRSGEADALFVLGRLHLELDENGEAVDFYRRALALREELGDTAKLAQSLSGLAGAYAYAGQSDQALVLEQRSLEIRESGGNPAAIADGLANLGYIHRTRDEIDEALDCYRKSLAVRSDAGDRAGAAWMLREMGLVQYIRRDYAEALNYYGQSLEIYKNLQIRREVAQTLYNTGVVHRALGDFDRALDCFEQSLRIRQEIGERSGVAACYYSMANTQSFRGSYAGALDLYQKSVEIDKALNRQLNVALALNGMANVYLEQGHPERSLVFYQDSLAISRALGQKRSVASTLGNAASARLALGEYDRALDGYRQSLALYEELEDRDGIANVLGNMGLVHLERKDGAKALEPLAQSLALWEEIGSKSGIARALTWTAGAHNAAGQFDRGVLLAARAADIARAGQDRGALWQACTALGEAYRALRQPEKAREAFGEGIRVVEDMWLQVAGDEGERASFLTKRVLPYQGMVELEVERSRPESALSYAERAKGRVLLEVLHNGREEIDAVLSGREREEEQKQSAAITLLVDRLSFESRRRAPDQNRIAGLRTDLEKARLAREAFETNIYAGHPELRVNRGQLPIYSVDETVALLHGGAGAFLEFVVTETRTCLFVVKRDATGGATVRVHTIAMGREDLGRRVEHFRQQIAGRDLGFQATATELFNLLLGPAKEQLKGPASLVIVPDGPLWDLPFQALYSGGSYLWEKCEIAYAPSLSVLREMTRLHDKRAAGRANPLSLLAMGNPSPEKAGGAGAGTLAGSGTPAPLPDVEDQVKRIGSLYGSRAKVCVGPDAAEERFKQEAGSYGILHLATHGILVDSNPLYSHLIMSHEAGEDGHLEAREILRLRLKADLVVLSACETARGRFGAGEGMIGLSWALFVAGCPATVVSQWSVDAAATTTLMVGFHGQLQKPGISKAAALRRAALDVMRNPRYRHPFYWAGFILVGDGF
jgi:CHAT domain-containing protein/Tfp pilus assembly protein PilF